MLSSSISKLPIPPIFPNEGICIPPPIIVEPICVEDDDEELLIEDEELIIFEDDDIIFDMSPDINDPPKCNVGNILVTYKNVLVIVLNKMIVM